MFYSYKLSEEVEVKTSISEAWEVYSTLKLAMITKSELGHLFGIEILEGDGGVGTIIQVTPHPGVSKIPAYKEKFTKIDHEKRVKVVDLIEGGHLELGFTSYRIIAEFFEYQKEDSCILRITVEYEASEDVVANADASIVTLESIMNIFKVANQYMAKNKN